MKKLVKTLLAAALVAGLAGCGGSKESDEESKVITIGATPSPHAEILNDVVADVLADEGWELEVTEFNDYVQPNTAVDEGELDANYFQHIAYMDQFNEENGTDLVAVAGVHLEPMGVFSKSVESLDDLKDGDEIAIPNDTTNESRALQILEAAGVIELAEDVDFYTPADITANPKNLKFSEEEAASLPRFLEDVAVAVINGNYAIDAGLTLADAIYVEDANSEGAYQWINYIAVKAGNENSDKIQALIKAVQSDEVKAYIEENYSESGVVVAFTNPLE